MWDTIAENEGGKVIRSDGRFRVYEKTTDGTNRVGVYDSESVAMDILEELNDHD